MHASLKAGLLGLLAGFIGGLVGIGGGLVMVPGLVLFLRLDQHRAHATSTAVIVVATTASVTPFILKGEVAWATGAWLLVGSVIGAYAGARYFMRIPAVWLARAFVTLAVVSAARLALT